MKIRRLSTRLALWLVPTMAVILLGAVWWQFREAKRLVVRNAEAQVDLLARLAEAELHRLLDPAQASTDIVASQLPHLPLSEEGIRAFILEFLKETPGVYGSTIALEPGAIEPGSPRLAPYFHRQKDGELRFVDLTRNDYVDDEWYRVPRETGETRWSAPYFDAGGGEVVMITYSTPFDRNFEGTPRFGGVITADVRLGRMSNTLGEAIRDRNGLELAIINKDNQVIAHSDKRWEYEDGVVIDLKPIDEPTPDADGEHPPAMQYDSRYLAGRTLAFSRKLDIQDWTLVLGIERETAFRKARSARDQIIAATGLGLLAMILIIPAITSRVTRPVALLAQTTRTIANGNLEFDLPSPQGHDEIAGLQSDFVHMRDALRENIAELERETRARQKLESELAIARDIQMGLLPNIRSLGTLRGFEIATRLIPARAVGGDLYNYFYLDDEDKAVLVFAVGDVSDKGIPAALFMARTNTLVRPATRYFGTPDAMLAWLASELTRDNAECMFVTLLCCTVDLDSGIVSLANASHLAPLIVRRHGAVELNDIEYGPPLGVAAHAVYPTAQIALEPGDAIILYSDGVTEAMNEAGEQYGEERLVELAASFHGMSPEEINEAILEALHAWAGSEPQSDDITVLVLQRTEKRGRDA